MLEKGFWFDHETEKTLLETVKRILSDSNIRVYPPITASVVRSFEEKNFSQLLDVLAEKKLISKERAEILWMDPHRFTHIVFRNTYERINPGSFLTREDVLVIAAENAGIPIKLSLAHIFIELLDGSKFEMAEKILASRGIESLQPEPLPLKERGVVEEVESLRYLSKQEVYYLSEEVKTKRGYLSNN
jgi:hypothetical protein